MESIVAYNRQPCANCTVSPPRRHVERIRESTPEPIVRHEVVRAPTPLPDVIERTVVKRQPQQIIERVVEQPRKPAPRVIEKIEFEPAPPPIVKTSSQVLVEPSCKKVVEPILSAPAPLPVSSCYPASYNVIVRPIRHTRRYPSCYAPYSNYVSQYPYHQGVYSW